MDKRRIILASIFITASIAIGATLYFFFFRQIFVGPAIEDEDTIEFPEELPFAGEQDQFDTTEEPEEFEEFEALIPDTDAVAQGGITQVTTVVQNTAIGLTAAADGSGIALYDKDAGKFYKIDDDGNQKLLTNKTFFNVDKVAFSPTQDKAVIEYPDGFNVVYDFQTDKQVTLPRHWEQFQFAKNGQKISAKSKGIHRSQNWLLTVNPDGSNARGIEPLGENAKKVIPAWNPGGQVVAFSKTGDPVGGEANEVYLIGQNNENFKSLIVDGYGFEPKWSKEGTSLMYSTYSQYNDYKPLIWVVDADGANVGSNRRELGISTWAHKCTYDSQTSIICAVPNELPKGAGYAPDVADHTPDTFFKIDTNTGLKTQLAIPSDSVNASNLQITPNGQYLFYENNFNGTVEKIRLK
tara:strand:- start:205 stop:1431 length:1227 start_codon:yes stop_codon:yes gene_type:complete